MKNFYFYLFTTQLFRHLQFILDRYILIVRLATKHFWGICLLNKIFFFEMIFKNRKNKPICLWIAWAELTRPTLSHIIN